MMAVPAGAPSVPTGALSGRVISGIGDRPAALAIWAGAKSTPVAPDGSFLLDGIPAGRAELAVQTAGGLYLVSSPVLIAPGTTRNVQLALSGRQDTSPPPAAEKEKKKKPGGVWANPTYATLIVVGSAIVVGVAVDQLTNSSSNPVSPSTPGN